MTSTVRKDERGRANLAIRRGWRSDWRVSALLVVGVAALLASLAAPASGAEPVPGSSGVDTSLPRTDSQVTVRGRGEFAALEVTVNQTQNLGNQAVSVTWRGGAPTLAGAGRFAQNYLQIMQCWGDPDTTVPENPGPPPDQCVFGAADAVYGGRLGSLFPSATNATNRIVSRRNWQSYDPSAGILEQETGTVWKPFRAVDGSVIGPHINRDYLPGEQSNYWLNPFFDVVTSNEIVGGQTSSAGTGAELFEVNTGVESSGLGCGQRLVLPGESAARIPPCWIVVVPRGSAEAENAGTGFSASEGVVPSPLAPSAWANRIAIPLQFNPVDSPCSIDAQGRAIVGSELALTAVASWQPSLCASEGLPPFTYGTAADSAARAQLQSTVPGAPGMAVSSGPIDPALSSPQDPVVYAPLTLSGAVLAFNIERIPSITAPPEMEELTGVRVQNLNLTPRLVAKLLTQSYGSQTAIGGLQAYEWAAPNPVDMSRDPDFLRFNPEFQLLQVRQTRNFGGLVAPGANSDLARQLWSYVLADPEAKGWLDGQPDEWGMVVNPVYNTTAVGNPNGIAFGDPVPQSFPKADPFCYQAPNVGFGGDVVPPRLCGTDWMPYVQSLGESARNTRAADDRARISSNPFALASDQVWSRPPPQALGTRAILSLTDTASARRYGLQTARLSRAGDEGDDRTFVAPDAGGLTTAVDAMTAAESTPVLIGDPTVTAEGAYPLAMLTYAAVRPLSLEQAAREEYAAFVEYAAQEGQVAGLRLGQLPPGYAPLPDALKAEAMEAAGQIRTLAPPPPEPSPETPDEGSAGGFGGGGGGFSSPPSSGSSPLGGPSGGASPVAESVPLEELAIDASVGEEADTTPSILTPILALATSRYFLIVLAAVSLLSALAIAEISKRPRRRPAPEVVAP